MDLRHGKWVSLAKGDGKAKIWGGKRNQSALYQKALRAHLWRWRKREMETRFKNNVGTTSRTLNPRLFRFTPLILSKRKKERNEFLPCRPLSMFSTFQVARCQGNCLSRFPFANSTFWRFITALLRYVALYRHLPAGQV